MPRGPGDGPGSRREDVRHRRLIERLAGPLDDMLQVLVQEAGVGIAIIDQRGRIVRVNDALRRMVDGECDLSPGPTGTGHILPGPQARGLG